MEKKIVIQAPNSIPFDVTTSLVSDYCEKHQLFKNGEGFLLKHIDFYKLPKGSKHFESVQQKGKWPRYWIKLRETKTSYIFEIRNAS